jgi:3-methyl-2-oxobutanoate hydroxymethyltransferase
MPLDHPGRIGLPELRAIKAAGRRFAMLTAYDYPTAAAAQAAGAHALLIGDSMGTVLLGHPNTRTVPLDLMITLGEAVRRGAPNLWLVGDLPYEALVGGLSTALPAARRFCAEARCDAVKLETAPDQADVIAGLTAARIDAIAHLGLRPQTVLTPDGYRAQARDEAAIDALVADARRMAGAGAVMLLLEAIPPEAAEAVISAVDIPVIGCGAGPACHGHVLVTQDMLGLGAQKPPRFVPRLADLGSLAQDAMQRYVAAVVGGSYPGPEHCYTLRKPAARTTHDHPGT